MSNELSTKLENTVYRMRTLNSRLKELERELTGENGSFLPLIEDADGKSDPQKLNDLIGEMIEYLKARRKELNNELKDWEAEMIASFLYCAMQTTRTRENNLYPHFGLTESACNFGDILDISEEVKDTSKIKNYREFLRTLYFSFRRKNETNDVLYYGVSHKSNFTGDISKFCELILRNLYELDGDKFYNNIVTVPIPRDTHIELCKEYGYENNLSDEYTSHYMEIAEDAAAYFQKAVDARKEYYGELVQNDIEREMYDIPYGDEDEAERREKIKEALRELGPDGDFENHELLRGEYPEDIANYLYEIELENKYKNERKYRDHIADTDELHKRFLRFIELYYENGAAFNQFSSDVHVAVISYLIEHGYTVLADDNRYGLVWYRLEQSLKQVEFEAERVKRLDD